MEDPFVELAKDCARTCHVLKTVAGGSGVDDLSGPNRKQIEDLGRCVNPAQPILPTITVISESYAALSPLSANAQTVPMIHWSITPGPPWNASLYGGQRC